VIARVFIVRHGETDENRQGIMQGQLDTKLNPAGVEQAQLTANALERVPLKAVYSSDLSRAVKTAEIILSKHPSVRLEKYAELRERYMGDLQGFRIVDYNGIPTNVETPNAFSTRAIQWWNRIIQRHVTSLPLQSPSDPDRPSTNILVTTHGGLIGVLVQTLLGSRKVRCAHGVQVGKCMNASITVVDVEKDGKGTLVSFADTTHLAFDLVDVNADVL
ncbi:phosphoglycerate mutase-like protein, partial [Abortiporus biennis]